MLDFLISHITAVSAESPLSKGIDDTFERLWQEKGGE